MLVLFSCLLFNFGSVLSANCAGCVPLDVLSFDKVLKKFPVSLVKFDVAYPYGDKHDQFAKVAKDAATSPDLLIGEVGIKDYGEKDNAELGERFGVGGKENFPAVILFVKNHDKGTFDHHKFEEEEFTAENILSFLKHKAGVYLPLKGCIEELDILAEKFVLATEDTKNDIVRSTEEMIKMFDPALSRSVEIYLKLMRKLIADGPGFLAKEEARLKKVVAGKLSNEKKMEIEDRMNILKSFRLPTPLKEEL